MSQAQRAGWVLLQTASKTHARQCVSSRGMSVAANHCQEQCFHPTSAQQSRAGPQFKQISHSASRAATPDDDLKSGHQKPHLLRPPSATSARSKAVQKCSLQTLHCAGHNCRGAWPASLGHISHPAQLLLQQCRCYIRVHLQV